MGEPLKEVKYTMYIFLVYLRRSSAEGARVEATKEVGFEEGCQQVCPFSQTLPIAGGISEGGHFPSPEKF